MEPSTTSCPLLPGQTVNVLDVPIEAIEIHARNESFSYIGSEVYTMDPKAKYVKLKPRTRHNAVNTPPARLLSMPARVVANDALKATIQNTPLHTRSSDVHQEMTTPTATGVLRPKPKSSGSPTKRMFLAALYKMRGIRSAGTTPSQELNDEAIDVPVMLRQTLDKSLSVRQAKLIPEAYTSKVSIASKNMLQTTPEPLARVKPALPPCEHRFSNERMSPLSLEPAENEVTLSFEPLVRMKPALRLLEHRSSEERISPLTLGPTEDEATFNFFSGESSRGSSSSYFVPLEKLQTQKAVFENSKHSQCPFSILATVELTSVSATQQTDALAIGASRAGKEESKMYCDNAQSAVHSATPSYYGSVSSYVTNKMFSPGLAASTIETDGMSPYHLAQPDTPSISEFEGDPLGAKPTSNLEPNVDSSHIQVLEDVRISPMANLHTRVHPSKGTFQGYSLPETEQASALTLRKLPSLTLESQGVDSPFRKPGSQALVHSWNDGSEHRITALEELVDDLGYLGELIV